MLKKIKFRSLNIDITSVIIDDAWGFKLNSEKYHFNFRGWLSCNMSGSNAKKSMIKWHTGWLGETERSRRDLQEKIKAKKEFIEQQNFIQKTALAKGEKLKSADALRQNLRAAELARVTVEKESKDLNALQEDLAKHMGKKPKTS